MTYIVNEKCIKCKYMDCVEVARSTASTKARTCWSFIPMNASIAASASPNARSMPSSRTPSPGLEQWLPLNAEYATKWPNITIKRERPADAKEFEDVPDKFAKYFSPNPGNGD